MPVFDKSQAFLGKSVKCHVFQCRQIILISIIESLNPLLGQGDFGDKDIIHQAKVHMQKSISMVSI